VGVRGLLALTGPEMPLDLLLDMGAVLDGRPDAGKEALRALDALMPVAVWRSAALLGGGFPRATADMLEEGSCEASRAEWRMWHEVRATGRAYAPLLGYGDYGVQPPGALAQAPASGRKGGPPWGALRYTTDSSYFVVKTLTRSPDRVAVNRAAARRITGPDEAGVQPLPVQLQALGRPVGYVRHGLPRLQPGAQPLHHPRHVQRRPGRYEPGRGPVHG
jgi:hypothetical protein